MTAKLSRRRSRRSALERGNANRRRRACGTPDGQPHDLDRAGRQFIAVEADWTLAEGFEDAVGQGHHRQQPVASCAGLVACDRPRASGRRSPSGRRRSESSLSQSGLTKLGFDLSSSRSGSATVQDDASTSRVPSACQNADDDTKHATREAPEGPVTRTFGWSGRRDSNPRPSPWQGEQHSRSRPLQPLESRSTSRVHRSRPLQPLHSAALE